jgi:aldose 1-epimerase
VIGPSANRIAGASFAIDGETYSLDVNDGKNNLHSHREKGYHKQLWAVETGENAVTFSLEDKDGSMGFPGNKKISVTYTLEENNTLRLHYHGTSDKKTVLNLTNHSYFNLDGHDSGRIEEHELKLEASCYTPIVAGAIPTGEIAPVAGTPMDFTSAKKVGRDIEADFEQLKLTGGYDHNWVIDGWDGTLRRFATVKGAKSGRVMEAYTTLPGFQFYAGNGIAEIQGKGGVTYGHRMGLCLETQYYPNSANQPEFPSCIFGAGREYDSVTEYRF